MTTTDFRARSRAVVKDFLQTAVIVDDDARYPAEEEIAEALVVPEEGALQAIAPQTASAAAGTPTEAGAAVVEAYVEHPLNAEEVVEAFAGIGIIAAVMRPDRATNREAKEFDESFLLAAGRADVVVMDWSLHRDDGLRAKRLMTSLLKTDVKERRLRLIAVYTGQSDLVAIARSIETDLGGLLETTEDEFVLAKDGLYVSILAKKESSEYKGPAKARVTPLDQLPERLVNEFADMTAGLLSNVALASIASLRRNTHTLVAKFRPGLDAAYLADAMVRGDHSASVALATSLVGREMRNVTDQNDVDALLDLEVLGSWLAWRRTTGAAFAARADGKKAVPLDDEAILDVIEHGPEAKKLPRDLKPGKLSPLDILDGPNPNEASAHEYAMLSFLDRSHTDLDGYERSGVPDLSLGSVVEKTSGPAKGRLFVCTQPVCDSVRVKGPRQFPFLPLVEAGGDGFDLAVRTLAGVPVRLNVALQQFALEMFTFDPDPSSATVKATRRGLFKARRQSFGWVAQLRTEQAQRLINSFANKASRVGLDETESGSRGRRSKLDG